MTSLRIEFVAVGGGRGRLGGQIDAREAVPLAAYALTVGTTPPVQSGQPLVPTGAGTVFMELAGVDAPVYVAAGASPDPTTEPRLLLIPGATQRVRAIPGHRISAVLAADVAVAGQATSRANAAWTETVVALSAGSWTQVSAANPARQKLILADPVGLGCLWSRSNAAPASGYAGGVPFSLAGAPGSYVFDDPVPRGAIFARAASAGSVTVVEA